MTSKSAPAVRTGANIPFYRDERILAVLVQVIFAVGIVVLFFWLFRNMLGNLDTLGISDFQEPPIDFQRVDGMISPSPWFRFLYNEAGFDILETSFGMEYSREDTYLKAFTVGIVNTIRVSILGIILTTILGVVTGIARLSSNWLLNKIALVYIEIFRNTPLLVQLFFWYFAGLLALPRLKTAGEVTAITLPGPVFLSNRGLALPWVRTTDTFLFWLLFLVLAIVLFRGIWVLLSRREQRRGLPESKGLWSAIGFLVVIIVGWFILPEAPFLLDRPSVPEQGFNFDGGLVIRPEFAAILMGLVLYTGAFIAEIVRAGIQAVSKGQTEAASALGLSRSQTLQLVILPQALRVIIPPMTSQYLNLVKNSSLATAVAFPEIFQVSGTILNQSGRAVQIVVMVMVTYLFFSLIISAFLNWYNKRIQLVER